MLSLDFLYHRNLFGNPILQHGNLNPPSNPSLGKLEVKCDQPRMERIAKRIVCTRPLWGFLPSSLRFIQLHTAFLDQ